MKRSTRAVDEAEEYCNSQVRAQSSEEVWETVQAAHKCGAYWVDEANERRILTWVRVSVCEAVRSVTVGVRLEHQPSVWLHVVRSSRLGGD